MSKLYLKLSVLAGAFMLSSLSTRAEKYWATMQGTKVPSIGERKIVPNEYKLIQIDQSQLQALLSRLPSNPDDGQSFDLPTPDGQQRTFRMWNSPMFEPELAAKFPEINTYTAVAIDNGAVTAKIDYTTKGFHAMIFDGENTYFIDPYSTDADGYYIVYYKKDYRRDATHFMSCDFDDDVNIKPERGTQFNTDGSLPAQIMATHGSQRKTYRLALSCTGEYAKAVDGSNPTTTGVLSAMTTTMNRVNGVYEREVSATMVFTSYQNQLIYLNPSTDPFYSNNDGGQLLDENQDNTSSIMPSSAYDIGHIFSTGGGGIAQLGCVCNNNYKAMGVTGSPNPVGDAYDVDYVCHEMGHQFGAEHTFNANTGGCYYNASETHSYEPGGGSTIMAYAGICGGGNDLQSNSDDYFHTASLLDISDFITNGFWGAGGSSCGTGATGTTPPTVAIAGTSFKIPYKTPFELIAEPASASPSDGITYCWEEWDLGNSSDFNDDEANGASFTTGPAFRSFPAVASQVRTFPKMQRILAGNLSSLGERTATVARTSKFKLTARNITDGWGTFNAPSQTVSLQVVNTGEGFKVTSQNSATTWATGSQQTVTWSVAQTNAAPISCNNVDIFMSADGGNTFPYIVATGLANTGTATITVPTSFNGSNCRIKVKGSGNVFFNVNSANITVTGTVGLNDIALENGLSIYPNPATDMLHIEYSKPSASLQVLVYNNMGQRVYSADMKGTANIQTSSFASGTYFVQILDVSTGGKIVKTVVVK